MSDDTVGKRRRRKRTNNTAPASDSEIEPGGTSLLRHSEQKQGTAKNARGRPSLIKSRVLGNLEYIEGWVRRGFTEQSIAKQLGVSWGTWFTAKRDHPEVDAAIRRGRQDSTVLVENALFRAAVGYDHTEVTEKIAGWNTDGTPIVAERIEKTFWVKGSVQAQIFYLQNRMPQRWTNGTNGSGRGILEEKNRQLGSGIHGDAIGMIDPGIVGSMSSAERDSMSIEQKRLLGIEEGRVDGKSEELGGGGQPAYTSPLSHAISKLNDQELASLEGLLDKVFSPGFSPTENSSDTPPSPDAYDDSEDEDSDGDGGAETVEKDEDWEDWGEE